MPLIHLYKYTKSYINCESYKTVSPIISNFQSFLDSQFVSIVEMRFLSLILITLVIGTAYSQLIVPDLSFVEAVQLSPRLVYHKKFGDFTTTKDPVNWARELLLRLKLDHLKYKLQQAMLYDNNKLLFEMEDYLNAIEVVRKWNKSIADEDYADVNSRQAGINDQYELTQTELSFFDNYRVQFRNQH